MEDLAVLDLPRWLARAFRIGRLDREARDPSPKHPRLHDYESHCTPHEGSTPPVLSDSRFTLAETKSPPFYAARNDAPEVRRKTIRVDVIVVRSTAARPSHAQRQRLFVSLRLRTRPRIRALEPAEVTRRGTALQTPAHEAEGIVVALEREVARDRHLLEELPLRVAATDALGVGGDGSDGAGPRRIAGREGNDPCTAAGRPRRDRMALPVQLPQPIQSCSTAVAYPDAAYARAA